MTGRLPLRALSTGSRWLSGHFYQWPAGLTAARSGLTLSPPA